MVDVSPVTSVDTAAPAEFDPSESFEGHIQDARAFDSGGSDSQTAGDDSDADGSQIVPALNTEIAGSQERDGTDTDASRIALGALDHLNGNIVEPVWNAVTDPAAEIAKLNSDGDAVVMRMTGEGKLQVPVPVGNVILGVGTKEQYGYRITVEQVGDTAPDQSPQYEVTFDKHLQAGLLIEPPIPGVDPAAELSPRTADRVTMRFSSQEDAARAVNILQRLALEETLRDGGALSDAASGDDLSLSNPASNPIIENSESDAPPPNDLADQVAPSEVERAFLRDNIMSYETTAGMQLRFKAAVKGFNLGIEPRIDRNTMVTRTVVLPQDGEPGRLTYTLSTEPDPTTKEKLTIGKQEGDQLEIGLVDANIVDHGGVRNEVSFSWDLPPEAFDYEVSGRPAPEIGAYTDGDGLGFPDEISGSTVFELQTLRSLADPISRTDLRRLTFDYSIIDPAQVGGPAISALIDGDVEGAMRQLGDNASVTATYETVRRDGFNNQPEIGVEFADVVELKGSVIAELGHDDILTRRSRSFTADDFADRVWGPEEPGQTQDPQFVVVPEDGLNIRSEPSLGADNISDFQHGTFVTALGETTIDETGREWAQVEGLDENDQVVTGWVAAEFLRPHTDGAIDGAGRIYPDLVRQSYESITVKTDDTIWDLARRNGLEFQAMLELNQDHIIHPGLIFPGDKVYIPGTGQPVPAQPPAQIEDSTGSGEPVDSAGSSDASETDDGSANQSDQTNSAETAESTYDESGEIAGDDGGLSDVDGAAVKVPEQADVPGPLPGLPMSERPDLSTILSTYHVPDDPRGMMSWEPNGGILAWGARQFTDPKLLTATEADLLNGMGQTDQLSMGFAQQKATETAFEVFPPRYDRRGEFPAGSAGEKQFLSWARNDGHADAFRHAYWNAIMTKRFGADFAGSFATAHEGIPGNTPYREAMDLYNNEVGRQIALAHPDADEGQLVELITQAIQRGELIVVDASGQLAWSDQVTYGDHFRRR